MQKIVIVLSSIVFSMVFASCSSKTEPKNHEDFGSPESTTTSPTSTEDLVAQGATLVKKSDCETCHHATNTIIGPSNTAVAEKYAYTLENIQLLAGKIIKGGSGVWGQVMMIPHPDLSQADAEKMARYILSLDGEKAPD